MRGSLSWNLRWRLSVLWFLEWGVTGAVMTYLPIYWESINLSKNQQAQLGAVTAVGLWIAPFVVGQVADRWMAIEKTLAISHFIGGIALFSMATGMELYQETLTNFQSLLWLTGIFACAYLPTVPLVSALCFRHLPDPDAQFGKVRVWGTVGWIAASLSLSFWLERQQVFEWLERRYPHQPVIDSASMLFRMLPRPAPSDCFRMSAILSFSLSSFCVFLPHTPPAKAPRGNVAPLAVLGMFRDPVFAMFMTVCFLLAVGVVPLYTTAVPPLLGELGVQPNWVPTVMVVGQISEFPALLLLSLCLRHMGLKLTFALGLAAWAVRYGLFAVATGTAVVDAGKLQLSGTAWGWVLAGLALHGVCHVFLMVVAQLYIDSRCRADLRATAQNLLSFLVLGIGMPVGMLLGGWLRERFQGNSMVLFAVPSAIAVALLVLFWKTVHFPDVRTAAVPAEPVPMAGPLADDHARA